MTRLVVIGAGGHAAACLDVLEAGRVFVATGLVDPKFPRDRDNSGTQFSVTTRFWRPFARTVMQPWLHWDRSRVLLRDVDWRRFCETSDFDFPSW